MSVKRKGYGRTPPRRQGEGAIQDGIRELITLKYKWRHKRNNVHGPARIKGGGGLARCGTKGEADLTVYIPHPSTQDAFRIVHLEVKKPKEVQEPEQIVWQGLVESHGEYYKVVRSQEDVENYFKEMGWSK